MAHKTRNYKTKQRQEIINYLKNIENSHITVQQISNYLKNSNKPVGITTIYRHLDTLVSEGIVKKYILDGVNGACFQYVEENKVLPIHFHFKCNQCGELIHFDCEELERLHNHLLSEHQMNIDLSKTIYYGTCKSCIQKI